MSVEAPDFEQVEEPPDDEHEHADVPRVCGPLAPEAESATQVGAQSERAEPSEY